MTVIVSAQTTLNHAIQILTAPDAGGSPGSWTLVAFESSGGGNDAFTVVAVVPRGAYYRYEAQNGVTSYTAHAMAIQ